MKRIYQPEPGRRGFIRSGSIVIAGAAFGLPGIMSSCISRSRAGSNGMNSEKEEQVSANEDLMREHGLLQRMLLIYDAAIKDMRENQNFNPASVNQTAKIIRNFIEDYHEKLEEDFVFPRMEKSDKHSALTKILRQQHDAGRKITSKVMEMTRDGISFKQTDHQQLIFLLDSFNNMYRPHEAREETVLFPAFKNMLPGEEYSELGEQFEKREHDIFGEDGFDMMVDKVAGIEKEVGIYELQQFTPEE